MKVRKLFASEDYLAIWIGFLMLAIACVLHFSQIDKIETSQSALSNQMTSNGSSAKEIKREVSKINSMSSPQGKVLKGVVETPKKWKYNPIDSLYSSKTGFTQIGNIFILFIALSVIFAFGDKLMGGSFRKFFKGFALLFALSILSFILAKQVDSSYLGLNYAIWAIVIGIIISNTVGTPDFLKYSARSEYFIKTGLVILGAEILMNKILAIGLPGIFVAWVVTPIVLIVTYIFGQRVLKLKSKSLNMTICADMSVCGVSAAIATAAATKAKKEELTIALTLSMVFTVIMMVVMPLIIKALGLPEVLGGAWIGGTLDSTGAVVAAGKFIGDKALNVAATIKMIQNVLIGVVAFGVALYWAIKVERVEGAPKPRPIEIWTRFPKFLLGFIGASIIFSIIYGCLDQSTASAVIDNGVIKGFTKNIKDWLFCLAFVGIGLNTNFKEFRKHAQGGKHITLYCVGQLFNILLTLGMAYLMFYVVFPEITAKI